MLRALLSSLVSVGLLLPLAFWASRHSPAPRWRTVCLPFGVFLLSVALLTLPWPRVGGYNWLGKLASIAAVWPLLLCYRPLAPARAYLVAAPRPGSGPAAVAVIAGLLVLRVGLSLGFHDHSPFEPSSLLFQATLPGLDEEPVYRAAFLGCLNTVCLGRWRVAGAAVGWAGVVSALLFGLAHALSLDKTFHFHCDVLTFGLVGLIGCLLVYLAERTRCLVVPILAHNLYNSTGELLHLLVR